MRAQKFTILSQLFLTLIIFLVIVNITEAIPSFARQTNMSCNTCHTIFPELNAFGRLFKLNGYTLTTAEAITAQRDSETTTLSLIKSSTLS